MKLRTLAAILALSAAAPLAHAQTPALTFTLETATTADKSAVVPRLTWATTPAAASCTAGGDWSGTKTATGTQLLAAVNTSKAYSILCNWPGVAVAALTWTAPTTNTDGSALTDLAGFRVQYGKAANEAALDTSVYLQSPTATSWTSPTLAPGAWFFGVKAYNALGLESALSNIVTKTTTAGASDTRSLTLGIKFPSAPVAQ
jgi:hypothetical protein